MNRILSSVLTTAAVLGSTSNLLGSQLGFTTPSWRGSSGSAYSGWEIFTVATNNGVGNLGDLAGSSTTATITQLASDAILTGTGNIYNVEGFSSFVLQDSALEPIGLVLFQARTLGSELDYNAVRLSYDLNGVEQLLAATRIENDRGTILGASVSSQWEWNLVGLGVTEYEIRFAAGGPSLSFDSASLDTLAASAVPEPTAWALGLVGALTVGWAARRTRRGASSK